MEKISLYIPCYNAQKTIAACLDSAFGQSCPADEIIVVDDGSNDATLSIAEGYPVRIFGISLNMGLAAARNMAFLKASNPLVAALDADCVADKDWLAALMRHLTDNRISGAGGDVVERHHTRLPDCWRSVHMHQSWGELPVLNPDFLFGSNTLFRKSAVAAAGFYDPQLRTNFEDVDISRKIYRKGLQLIYEPGAKVEHLRQDNAASVLRTYCRWHEYESKETIHRSGLCGALKRYAGIIKRTFARDLARARFNLLILDLMLIFYYPFTGGRKWIA